MKLKSPSNVSSGSEDRGGSHAGSRDSEENVSPALNTVPLIPQKGESSTGTVAIVARAGEETSRTLQTVPVDGPGSIERTSIVGSSGGPSMRPVTKAHLEQGQLFGQLSKDTSPMIEDPQVDNLLDQTTYPGDNRNLMSPVENKQPIFSSSPKQKSTKKWKRSAREASLQPEPTRIAEQFSPGNILVPDVSQSDMVPQRSRRPTGRQSSKSKMSNSQASKRNRDWVCSKRGVEDPQDEYNVDFPSFKEELGLGVCGNQD
ncbi:hypothetical protein LWI29_037154 [Acer saccharum]|uniref:Uncharacterized protein n=1 Tax=Acer saccharum TaxID=4024 RepID=A0AA39VUW6_ACESA|nr:hypothetical protein LWI29_037154 [Acer saccharum]